MMLTIELVAAELDLRIPVGALRVTHSNAVRTGSGVAVRTVADASKGVP